MTTSFFFYSSEKISHDILCESSAWQMIHIKCDDLFFLKNKKKLIIKILEYHLLQILLGTLRFYIKFLYGGHKMSASTVILC